MPAIAERPGVRVANTEDRTSIGLEATRRAQIRARKAGLLSDAARHFSSISRPTARDITIFKELFYQLVDGADKGERRSLAAILSRNVYTPRTVLIFLALDDPDIAAPVLMFSEALNEIDLAGIILRISQAHLEILCRRNTLTPATAERLIAKGGERCREILAKNLALKTDERMQAVIRHFRVGMPVAQTEQPVRQTRVAEPAPVRQPPAPQVARTTGNAAEAALMGLAARGGNLGRQQAAREGARYDPSIPFERQALRVARIKDPEAFAMLVKEFCGAPVAQIAGVLRDGGSESACVLLKGLGLSDPGALQCLIQLDPAVARSLRTYNAAKETLAGLDSHSCRKFLENLGARQVRNPAPGATAASPQAVPARPREIARPGQAAAQPAAARTGRSLLRA